MRNGELESVISFADVPVTAEDAFARSKVNAAYGAAPPELQDAVAADVAAMGERPDLTRYGVVVSEPARRALEQPAQGRFKFKDGWNPGGLMTADDVLRQTMEDVNFWADLDPTRLEVQRNPQWQRLEKRFTSDPLNPVDPRVLAGSAR